MKACSRSHGPSKQYYVLFLNIFYVSHQKVVHAFCVFFNLFARWSYCCWVTRLTFDLFVNSVTWVFHCKNINFQSFTDVLNKRVATTYIFRVRMEIYHYFWAPNKIIRHKQTRYIRVGHFWIVGVIFILVVEKSGDINKQVLKGLCRVRWGWYRENKVLYVHFICN